MMTMCWRNLLLVSSSQISSFSSSTTLSSFTTFHCSMMLLIMVVFKMMRMGWWQWWWTREGEHEGLGRSLLCSLFPLSSFLLSQHLSRLFQLENTVRMNLIRVWHLTSKISATWLDSDPKDPNLGLDKVQSLIELAGLLTHCPPIELPRKTYFATCLSRFLARFWICFCKSSNISSSFLFWRTKSSRNFTLSSFVL